MSKIVGVIVLVVVAIGLVFFFRSGKPAPTGSNDGVRQEEDRNHRAEFASFNSVFPFSVEVPNGWQVEYVPGIEAINIYDPNKEGSSVREKSQIFIRYFEANTFLTLSTVDILSREETNVGEHAAVRYEIKKKAGAANFPEQPLWRSGQHKLIDVRFTQNSPSLFFVFAYNPTSDEKILEDFMASLVFHNDKESLVEPLSNASERVTKKPFGLQVSPDNSPVSPEKFTGYHNAVDYEAFPEEIGGPVEVRAVCGGKFLQKRTVQGYGGFLVQSCDFENQPVTVVYGHIAISSVSRNPGDYILPGEVIAVLGEQGPDTDEERKHLHLGVHKGTVIDIRGYVQNQNELTEWIDFESYKD